MSQFPKMLYRAGTALAWAGKRLDTRIVASAVEEEEAFAQGWHRGPEPERGGPAPNAPRGRRGRSPKLL